MSEFKRVFVEVSVCDWRTMVLNPNICNAARTRCSISLHSVKETLIYRLSLIQHSLLRELVDKRNKLGKTLLKAVNEHLR